MGEAHHRDDGLADLRRLVGSIPVSMVVTDPHRPRNPIVHICRAVEEVTGYTAWMAVGHNRASLHDHNSDQPGLETSRARIEAWRLGYNQECPHSALGDLIPGEFAEQLKTVRKGA
jgi:transposase InsO family protein